MEWYPIHPVKAPSHGGRSVGEDGRKKDRGVPDSAFFLRGGEKDMRVFFHILNMWTVLFLSYLLSYLFVFSRMVDVWELTEAGTSCMSTFWCESEHCSIPIFVRKRAYDINVSCFKGLFLL